MFRFISAYGAAVRRVSIYSVRRADSCHRKRTVDDGGATRSRQAILRKFTLYKTRDVVIDGGEGGGNEFLNLIEGTPVFTRSTGESAERARYLRFSLI